MATATQLMPSPSGLKSMSAFSPYTDSPSSPGTFAHVFSNRWEGPERKQWDERANMDSRRSSGHTSDHLHPPPSPYPATVDPSPVDSNGTSHTDHTEVDNILDGYGEHAGLTPPQIEDDAQVNHPSEDGMSDIRSPGTDDIVSPASQESQAKVWRA